MDITQLDFKQVFIWVLIWLVGYALGLFEGWVKNKRKRNEKPKAEVLDIPPKIIEEDYSLAIFETESGITLKLDKTELKEIDTMNAIQRKRLLSLVMKLRPWLDAKAASHQTPAPPQAPRSTVNEAPTVKPSAPAVKPVVHAAHVEYKSQPITGSASLEELEYNQLSMVEQIDWLLQRKLQNHPLKERRIRLQGALTGGVNFIIGEENYEFIDEIPYPEIRAIIQIAINEWEKKDTHL